MRLSDARRDDELPAAKVKKITLPFVLFVSLFVLFFFFAEVVL